MPGLDRSTIANIETGRRRRIGVDEWLTLAYVLDVAPLHLLLPRADDDEVRVTPTVTVNAAAARRWAAGREPLPGGDERTYRYEVPDREYQRRSQRVADAEANLTAARGEWEVAEAYLQRISADRAKLDNTIEAAAMGLLTSASTERLDARLDVAYDRVAATQVALRTAEAELRRIKDEEATDGQR